MNIDFLSVFFVDFLSVIVKCMICFDKFPILLPGFILLYFSAEREEVFTCFLFLRIG